VAFAGQIPVFLLAPIGGMEADRWPTGGIGSE